MTPTSRMRVPAPLAAALLVLAAVTCARAQDVPEAEPPLAPAPAAEPELAVEETVVVTASRVEEPAHDAPVAVSVVGPDVLETTPATTWADLLRGFPGVSVVQLGAKDAQVTTRGPAGVALRGNLLVVDGRTLNEENDGLAFFDHLPVDLEDVQSVEVVNGPASATWGPHALHGVVHVRTKRPRDATGGFLRLGLGEHGRREPWLRWAAASRRVSWRVSGGYAEQDPWPRPLAKPDGTPFPPGFEYVNRETEQTKIDARVDVDLERDRSWSFRAGRASSGGVAFTGNVPFWHHPGTATSYADVAWTAPRAQARFTWTRFAGTGTAVLGGAPSDFRSDVRALELLQPERRDLGRHRLSWGAVLRSTGYDVDAVPNASSRTDAGAFVQDAWTLREVEGSKLTLHLGTRLDHFETSGLAVSPRVALVWDPSYRVALRASWSRAFRSPTILNGFLDLTVPSAVDLGLGSPFVFDLRFRGNPDLDEVVAEQLEVGLHAFVGSRHELSAAAWRKDVEDDIVITTAEVYSPQDPPAGWPLDPSLVPPLPKVLSYANAGRIRGDGLEMGLRTEWGDGVATSFTWTWQDAPDVRVPTTAGVNVPPKHQLGALVTLVREKWKGSFGVTFTDRAFWADVLDSRFWGWTDDHVLVSASAAVPLPRTPLELAVGATNLLDERVQQHVFGDVIGRQATLELRARF